MQIEIVGTWKSGVFAGSDKLHRPGRTPKRVDHIGTGEVFEGIGRVLSIRVFADAGEHCAPSLEA